MQFAMASSIAISTSGRRAFKFTGETIVAADRIIAGLGVTPTNWVLHREESFVKPPATAAREERATAGRRDFAEHRSSLEEGVDGDVAAGSRAGEGEEREMLIIIVAAAAAAATISTAMNPKRKQQTWHKL